MLHLLCSNIFIKEIRDGCYASVETKMKGNHQKIVEKNNQSEDAREKLFSLEEKWIRDEISRDTYER